MPLLNGFGRGINSGASRGGKARHPAAVGASPGEAIYDRGRLGITSPPRGRTSSSFRGPAKRLVIET